MTFSIFFAIAATVVAAGIGIGAFLRKPKALASLLFLIGMALIAMESAWSKLLLDSRDAAEAASLLSGTLVIKAFLPGVWLCFSLVYCRGNRSEFIHRWRGVLAVAFILPPAIAIAGYHDLVSLVDGQGEGAGKVLHLEILAKILTCVLVVFTILTLVNLEKTFRASVGLTRWRIKYLFLGTGLIFGAKFYTLSQLLLFAGYNVAMGGVDCVAVVIGCCLMMIGYTRRGPGELSIYPSLAVLQGSVTFIVAGGYLLAVGVFAQVVAALGGSKSFPAQALIILLGAVGLLVLLLSDRFRNGLQRLISRHFRRPQHDFRKVWTEFTRRTSSVMDRTMLCETSSQLVSETFNVLTVTVFISERGARQITRVTSTFESTEEGTRLPIPLDEEVVERLVESARPFELDQIVESWADPVRIESPLQFENRGGRLAVPLVAGQRLMGIMVLADQVDGVPFSSEELDLLKCLSDQLAAALLNGFLTEELMSAKEMEAFQTMSTFFVHDLKNAANSMSLMLQNLPIHFDDPEFRKDALRGIGKTVERINQLIAKLSTLRENPTIAASRIDVNELISEITANLKPEMSHVELIFTTDSVPEIFADREQIRSVLLNLIVNAAESISGGGRIQIETGKRGNRSNISIADNGCGMTRQFVHKLLFRPFHSTKSKGLGIGMFQCKRIIEAHQGSIIVESEQGRGTTFHISLPFAAAAFNP